MVTGSQIRENQSRAGGAQTSMLVLAAERKQAESSVWWGAGCKESVQLLSLVQLKKTYNAVNTGTDHISARSNFLGLLVSDCHIPKAGKNPG